METEISKYWRTELGREFRAKILNKIGMYAENLGVLDVLDGRKYHASFNLSSVIATIIPLSMSCNMSSRKVSFVAYINVDGHVNKSGEWIRDNIELFDTQLNKINTDIVCVNSLLILLDCLHTAVQTNKIIK